MLLHGSYNYSQAAHTTNSEDILVVRGGPCIPLYQSLFQRLDLKIPRGVPAIRGVPVFPDAPATPLALLTLVEVARLEQLKIFDELDQLQPTSQGREPISDTY